jgi:hypothetical protein
MAVPVKASSGLVCVAVLWAFSSFAAEPVSKDSPGAQVCATDKDCAPSRTCTYCGQCYSKQPTLEIDCKAYCLHVPSCACVNRTCVPVTDAGTR